MTAVTVTNDGKLPSPMIWLGLFLLVIVLMLAVKNGTHSVTKHPEATQIHQCLDGPDKGLQGVTWKSNSWRTPNKYFQTCQLDDGRWGIRIIECTKQGWQERTSFVPKQGTDFQIMEYLSARASWYVGQLVCSN